MKGHFYFCDNCDKKEYATLPNRVKGNYTNPAGWISVTEKVNDSYFTGDFCSRQCAITAFSEELA